jgi:hypothetical protein
MANENATPRIEAGSRATSPGGGGQSASFGYDNNVNG